MKPDNRTGAENTLDSSGGTFLTFLSMIARTALTWLPNL